MPKGNGDAIFGGVNGPTRPNMWDTSLRIPLLIRWPGTLQPGSEVNETVLNLDMFQSVLGLLKVKPPAEVRHNGKDFTPLLFGSRDPNKSSDSTICTTPDWPTCACCAQTTGS